MRPLLLLLSLAAALPARSEEPCAPVKPCEVGGEAPEEREPPAEFTDEVRDLHRLLGCQGPVPEGLDPAVVKGFCARRAKLLARTAGERQALQAALGQLRPVHLPSAVVFPLSGSDLLSALWAHPDARSVTLTSALPCGNPQAMKSLREPQRLRRLLATVEREGERLLHGRGGEVPAAGERLDALPLLLWALGVEGSEPVGLRFFRVEPAGTLRYLGTREIAAAQRDGPGPGPFESCEVAFLRRGEPAGAPARFARNLRADLAEAGIAADPGPLAHLDAKGKFVGVLAGAGALSGEQFRRLRELLLRRATVVVSDGSGPSPDEVREAGLVPERRARPGSGGELVILRRP